jgi:single-strand DNA-binding protein
MLLAHNYACLTGEVTSNQITKVNNSLVCNLMVKYSFQRNRELHRASIAVSLWGETQPSEMHQQYPVGSHIQVEGYLESDVTERSDGKKQSIISLVATYIHPTIPESSFNRVILIGQTGADPESRYLESGGRVLNTTLAVNRVSKDKEDPYWFALEMWGKTADIYAAYGSKGSRISVIGSLLLDTWKDKETGHDRFKPVIQTQSVRLLNNKREVEPVETESLAVTV